MFQTIIGAVSSFMYSKLLVIILIGAGLYFTIRTRFPQVRLFERACESVMESRNGKYCRGVIGNLYWGIWFCILDVGDCDHWKCVCTD